MLQVRVGCGCGPWSGAHGDAGHEWRYADIPSACLPSDIFIHESLPCRYVFLWNGPALFGGCPLNNHAQLSAFFWHTRINEALQSNSVFLAVTWSSSTLRALFSRESACVCHDSDPLVTFRNSSVKFLKLVPNQILKTDFGSTIKDCKFAGVFCCHLLKITAMAASKCSTLDEVTPIIFLWFANCTWRR